MLLGQHTLNRARDAVVLATGAGADEKLDIAGRTPSGCRLSMRIWSEQRQYGDRQNRHSRDLHVILPILPAASVATVRWRVLADQQRIGEETNRRARLDSGDLFGQFC